MFEYDTALVADSREKLQNIVTKSGRVCDRWSSKVNVSKNRVKSCSRDKCIREADIVLNGEIREQVARLRYLEVDIEA